MKRAMRINYVDGTFIDLEISKATSVKTSKSMINLDRLDNGTWRLIYDDLLISDFSKVSNFQMIRED